MSREVPPPAAEAGGAETRSDRVVWQEGSDPVADIDAVESQESDLEELFNVVTRDAVSEMKEHD